MLRTLDDSELAYTLEHLNLAVDIAPVKNRIVYGLGFSESRNMIIFRASDQGLNIKEINETPLLFTSDSSEFYNIDSHGNLIFHHDLLKAAFYLLSGYDEQFVNKERDRWGRVAYAGSIQKKMDIIHRPLVNEYFDLILQGIHAFLNHHAEAPLKKRKLFDTFGFLLSHDIDVVDKYGWPHLGYKLKELVGLAPSNHSKAKILKATLISAFEFINPFRSNPYWNFRMLMTIEKTYGIKAAYYFLAKDANGGSRYSFSEARMLALFEALIDEGHEVGIHGTTKTAGDVAHLKREVNDLENASKTKTVGGRQHRLWLDVPLTFHNHQQAGLAYDSSFGFAEHEGFRNSFCLPFRPYDFENERAIDCWQFPLMAMDVTLFSYRKLSPNQMIEHLSTLLAEVKKHNGIFTLLWHNSFFDETLYPGITRAYLRTLDLVKEHRGVGITGKKLTSLISNLNET